MGALFRRIICLSINRVGVIGVYENRETRRRENDVFSQFKTTLCSKNNFFFFKNEKTRNLFSTKYRRSAERLSPFVVLPAVTTENRVNQIRNL